MALRPLNVRITGDTSQFESALGRAQRGLRGFAIAGAAAAGAVTGALIAMSRSGLKAADDLAKMSRSMGATANGLRAVQIAAGYAGVSVQDVNTSLQQMNRELVRAREEGTPAAESLERLGMRARDLEQLDADDRMAAIADRVRELGLSSGETSDILRDLGVRSRQMSLLLMGGSEAIRSAREEVRAFGLELSETQLASIESANDAVDRMGLVFEGLRNKLAVEVAPVLEDVANSFNEFARSEEAQAAVSKLADAFGRLVEVAGSEEFLTGIIGAFEGMINVSTMLADGLVLVTQNIETLTVAAGAAAIAIAAMGGPIGVVVRLAAAAGAGLLTLSRNTRTLAEATDAASTAEDALNEAIGEFNSAAPSANGLSIERAQALQQQAEAALSAAEAELALAQAMLESRTVRGGAGGAMAGVMDPEGRQEAIEDYEAATDRVNELNQSLNNVRRTVQSLVIGGTGGGGGAHALDPIDLPFTGEEDEEGGGGGGGGGLANAFEERLEVLLDGLQTEREVLDAWYEESLITLQEARERQLLTEKEFLEARARLEKEYAERSRQIESMRQDNQLQTFTSGMNDILSAAAQGNEGLMRIQKVFAAGMAWIDTLQGAARELRAGTFGFAQAAAVIAKGISFIAAINSTSTTSRGGAGGAQTAPVQPSMPTQNVLIDLVGASTQQVNQFQLFADTFNEAQRQGLMANVVVRGT